MPTIRPYFFLFPMFPVSLGNKYGVIKETKRKVTQIRIARTYTPAQYREKKPSTHSHRLSYPSQVLSSLCINQKNVPGMSPELLQRTGSSQFGFLLSGSSHFFTFTVFFTLVKTPISPLVFFFFFFLNDSSDLGCFKQLELLQSLLNWG